jgi:hypothetical protein
MELGFILLRVFFGSLSQIEKDAVLLAGTSFLGQAGGRSNS